MHLFHIRHGYDATVAVSLYEMQVPFGVIRQSSEGLLAGIDEKPRANAFHRRRAVLPIVTNLSR